MIQGNLMIGDWVLHDGKYKKVDVNWGCAVSLNDPSKTYGSIYSDKYSLEEVEPIPLKKIHFTKNGFEPVDEDDRVFVFSDGYRIEIVFDDGIPQMSIPPTVYMTIEFAEKELDMPIEYVHQLQQAMRLFEIEKEFEL